MRLGQARAGARQGRDDCHLTRVRGASGRAHELRSRNGHHRVPQVPWTLISCSARVVQNRPLCAPPLCRMAPPREASIRRSGWPVGVCDDVRQPISTEPLQSKTTSGYAAARIRMHDRKHTQFGRSGCWVFGVDRPDWCGAGHGRADAGWPSRRRPWLRPVERAGGC